MTPKALKRAIGSLGLIAVVALVLASGPDKAKEAAGAGPHYTGTLLIQMRVSNLDRAVSFYKDVLGFEIRLRSDTLKWAELTFGPPDVAIGLGEGAEVKGSGSVSLNIGVEDVDATRKLLETRGVKFTGETVVVPDKVKLAEFSDPDGNRIRLAERLGRP